MAATAALTGTLVASLNGSVFLQDFEFRVLIAVYTMVILGGAGSQAGVVLGAILVSVLEVLREPGDSRAVLRRDAARPPRSAEAVAPARGSAARDHRLGFVARSSQANDETWTSGRRRRRPSRGLGPDWVIVPQSLAGGWRPPRTSR